MEPVIDHIEITVKDLEQTVSFYDQFLPLLGFSPDKKTSAYIASHDKQVVEYSHPIFVLRLPHHVNRKKMKLFTAAAREHYITWLLKLNRAKKLIIYIPNCRK